MLFPVAAMAQKNVKISDDISITQLSDKVYTYVSLAEIEGWGMVPSNGMIVINNHQAVAGHRSMTHKRKRWSTG